MRHGPGKIEKIEKKDLKHVFSNISASMRKYLPLLLIALILLIAGVVISVTAPDQLKVLTNTINDGAATKSIDLDKVKKYGLILVGMYLISATSTFFSGFIMNVISMRYTEQLRKQIIAKINRVPLRYFDSSSIGDVMSRLTNDVDQIGQSMQQSVSTLFQSVFMIIGVLIAMFISSWQLALVCVATLPLMMIVILFILKIAGPWFQKRQDMIGDVESVVEENYNGQLIIKVFDSADRINEDFEKHNKELGTTLFKSEIFGGLMQPIMNFVSYLAYAAVCLTGGLLMNAQSNDPATATITIGTITAFLSYVNLFQSPLTQIAQSLNSLQSAAAAAKRVFEFLGEKELEDESGKENKLLKDGNETVRGEVTFEHVSFGYDETREIIHDFSAEIKPGMKVAIVGPTGAGKTTMVNLLMRFYEVGKGSIKIDGIDIKTMPRSEIHSLFAMVLQDTWVYEGTLRENLEYNTKGLSDEDLDNAIHDAHLVHFVRSLPGGLNYQIEEDNSISGGQKQLITIARAMLKKAPLLILDEATSNVDTRTEEKIQEAMDRLTKGKTSFVIAHRLSTIKNADMILVMKDGNIVEQGNHDELMEKKGFYYGLYSSQFDLNAENTID